MQLVSPVTIQSPKELRWGNLIEYICCRASLRYTSDGGKDHLHPLPALTPQPCSSALHLPLPRLAPVG